jgi:hypothetical protein
VLTVQSKLLQAFERSAFEGFVEEMIERAWQYSPRLCGTLKDEELELAVRSAIDRAGRHGFAQRGSARFFLQTSIALGSAFDDDPQYPWAAETLASDVFWSPMDKADALHARVVKYVERVEPTSRDALLRLRALAGGPLALHDVSLAHDIAQILREAHPAKAEALGDAALDRLVEAGLRKSEALGFAAPRARLLVVTLMFVVGHAFDRDPFLPWIARTLEPERGAADDRARVAERLERRAMIWIEAVLDASERDV